MNLRQSIILAVAVLVAGGCSRSGDGSSERAAVAVKTMVVGGGDGVMEQGYTGTVEEQSATALSFSTGGTVARLLVDDGQMVSRGQLLATVDAATVSNGVEVAQATTSQAGDIVEQAEAVYAQALDAYNRMKVLHDQGSLPEIQWIEAETRLQQAETALKSARSGVRSAQASERIARKGLADTRLTAPTAGYVARRSVEVGQNVLPGAPVLSLLNIDRVKVKFSVPEQEVSHFATGQTVTVTVAALGGRTYRARVVERGVNADPLSRTYEIKAAIDNGDHSLLPGMMCAVEAQRTVAALQVVALPAAAVELAHDNTTFVWTVVGGKARRTVVSLGQSTGDRVAVVAGLQPGDTVIVEGQQKVSTGMDVKQL